jgi:hypothetical protein
VTSLSIRSESNQPRPLTTSPPAPHGQHMWAGDRKPVCVFLAWRPQQRLPRHLSQNQDDKTPSKWEPQQLRGAEARAEGPIPHMCIKGRSDGNGRSRGLSPP